MSIAALSKYTFYSRYARYNKEKKRRETWSEAVSRVYDMHRIKYAKQIEENPELSQSIDFAQHMQTKKRVLAAQRSLQFAGDPIFKHELKMYNCLFTHIDREKVFSEIFFSLLAGSGVGFSVQKQHVEQLPNLIGFLPVEVKTHVITDSIEGWADAVGVLIASFLKSSSYYSEYTKCKVEFDYSAIRPKGALIAGIFKAPGPDGLKLALDKIYALLVECIQAKQKKLAPIDCYDIIMHVADATLSGGIRRAATLCLFSHDDEDMLTAKTGNWYKDNPQRGRSNNSAALLKGSVTREEFSKLMKSTKEFGEPGFIWMDDLEFGFNPCVSGETMLHVKDHDLTENGECIAAGVEYQMPISLYVENYVSPEVSPLVLSYDGKAGENKYCHVNGALLTRKDAEVVKIILSDSNSIIKCTSDHKIYTLNRGYVEAKDLDITYDKIKLVDGYSFINRIQSIENEDVYDISVPATLNFYGNDILVHNCVEIGMYPKTRDGRSGFQGCNLTEINGKWCNTKENFLRACEAASIIGTLQAGYTNFTYLSPESKEIFEDVALLGCSITGMMDNPDIIFNKDIQREGAEYIKSINEKVAKMIGINPAARAVCVKPAGSTSCILGSASGIHPHHAKRYIRRIQGNNSEFAVQETKRLNPLAVEESVWSVNKTDSVISFLCEVPPGAVVKNQLSAVELLEKVKLTQQNWVEYGTNVKRNRHPKLRHNVSNTITVKPDEWDEVEKFIFDNQKWFAGISLLPASGDLDYAQAPFSTVLTPNEIVKEYGDGSVFASGLIVDGLSSFDNNLWKACDTVLGYGEDLSNELTKPEYPIKKTNKDLAAYFLDRELYDIWFNKIDWVRRVKQFAERYFSGDTRRATYCIKHVSLWKTWCDLKREYVEIDWDTVYEEFETVVSADTLGAQACSGGQCELI